MHPDRTNEDALFSKRVNNILLVLSIIGIAGSMLVLFPQIRFFIISLGERLIVHRPLDYPHWDTLLFAGALTSIFFFIVLFVVSVPLMIWFLAENYTMVRWLLILPVVMGFLTITFFGVNIPFWDEWDLVTFVNGTIEQGIQFDNFFAPHNEHRIFFPRIVFFISAYLSHFNVKVNMYLSLILVTGMYGLYLVYLKNTIKGKTSFDKLKRMFFSLILGFCCFNIVQHENILWGFQVGFFMVAAFSVLCFYGLYRGFTEKNSFYLLFSALMGFISAFSSIHGLFVFPVIIIILFLLFLSGEKIPFKYVLFVSICMVIIYTIYFYDYSGVSYHQKYYYINSLYKAVLFFFAALGSPFAFRVLPVSTPAIAAGILLFLFGITLTIYSIFKKKVREYIFPLCLIYFGYAFCGAVAIGRSGSGIGMALLSRYTTFALFAIIGLAIIMYSEFNALKQTGKLGYIVINGIRLMMIILLLQYIFIGDLAAKAYSAKVRQAAILNYKNQTLDTLRNSYPWTDLESAYNYIEILEKNRWSLFYK
jgi:hypothetical protein